MFLRSIAMMMLVLLVAAGPALAAREACTSRADVLAFVGKELPGARVLAFGGGDAKAFLTSLASATRVPAPEADEVLVVDLQPGLPIIKVVIFRSGCLVAIGSFQRAVVRTAINAIAKSGA